MLVLLIQDTLIFVTHWWAKTDLLSNPWLMLESIVCTSEQY